LVGRRLWRGMVRPGGWPGWQPTRSQVRGDGRGRGGGDDDDDFEEEEEEEGDANKAPVRTSDVLVVGPMGVPSGVRPPAAAVVWGIFCLRVMMVMMRGRRRRRRRILVPMRARLSCPYRDGFSLLQCTTPLVCGGASSDDEG
jgi:hypothetical protein